MGGEHLVSTSHDMSWRLWDIERSCELLLQEGHSRPTYAASVHPDGSLLATAADDHSIRIWDLRRRRCVHNLLAHNKLISEVSFEGAGRLMLSSSYDGTVKLWSTTDWRMVKVLIGHEGRVMGADHIPSSLNGHHYVGSVAFDRTLKFWSTQGKEPQ